MLIRLVTPSHVNFDLHAAVDGLEEVEVRPIRHVPEDSDVTLNTD